MLSVICVLSVICYQCLGFVTGPCDTFTPVDQCRVRCIVYSVECAVYSVEFAVYSVQSKVYSVHYTMYIAYSVHCALYSVQCTLFTIYTFDQCPVEAEITRG